jgi:diguanylate cyclase (GGDEF)-like protein/PAS domain S-box-containing protein
MPSRFRHLDDPESLRRFVQGLREGIYITTPDGEILDGNPAFLKMLGVASLEELRGQKAPDLLVDPQAREREKVILARDGAVREFELQFKRRNGEILTVIDTCFTVTDPATGETFYHGILVDITDRKRLELQLLEQSERDPLTGCYNRRYLEKFEGRYTGDAAPWGCIIADLDHFKRYNDQYGHEAGDYVLNKFARFLMRQTRAEEAVVRMGGDEFLLLLPKTDETGTENTADRLQFVAEKEMLAPFSLGYSSRQDNEALDRTIQRADQKMISVKGVVAPPSGIWKRLA